MEVKIQKLENIVKEAEKNVREKDDRINQLQAQMRVKAATSELTQLEAKLNETEKCLSTVLAENRSLQVGVQLFSSFILTAREAESAVKSICSSVWFS